MSAETNCLATDQRTAPQTQVERFVGMIGRSAALRRVVPARTASLAGLPGRSRHRLAPRPGLQRLRGIAGGSPAAPAVKCQRRRRDRSTHFDDVGLIKSLPTAWAAATR